MKCNVFTWVVTGTAALAVAASASADVMFERALLLDGDDGPWSDSIQQVADSFMLDAGVTINHASWYGNFYLQGDPFNTGDTWDFTVRMFEDNAGMPQDAAMYEVPVTASITDDGIQQGADRIYLFEADLAPVDLEADTQYYLSILSSTNEAFRWNNGTPDDGLGMLRYSDDGSWLTDNDRRLSSSFTLEAVPTPGAVALLAVAGLAGRRRRR